MAELSLIGIFILVLWLIPSFFFAFVCGAIADYRGMKWPLPFLCGFLLGPIGLIVACLTKDEKD
jgi:MFS family permease